LKARISSKKFCPIPFAKLIERRSNSPGHGSDSPHMSLIDYPRDFKSVCRAAVNEYTGRKAGRMIRNACSASPKFIQQA
jgi:hypothetical protein